MNNELDIDQQYPPNMTERLTRQEDGQIYPINDAETETQFAAIRVVNRIQSESTHQLFKLDCDGKSIRTYDPLLQLYLKGIRTLFMPDSNYHCEHLQVLQQAYKEAVAPFIVHDDEPMLWRAEPNRIFYTYDEETEEILSSKTAAELINAFVYQIYILINKQEFKKAQSIRADRSKNQYDRSCKLVKRLRSKFSKLLVLRIDFCWKARIQSDSTFHEMKAYFAQMMKNFHHDKDLPNIVGYIWKLEFGQQKGYHYHCIFFMDGNKFQNDAYYAEAIGQYWSKLTLDKGYYFNCHRDKIKYRNLAIGMAHHDDQSFFNNLDQVLLYICKQDQFLIDQRFLTRGLRVFQTSKLPTEANTVGRPRKFYNKATPTVITQSRKLAIVVKNKSKQISTQSHSGDSK